MADTMVCPFCKAEGKAGIMELQRVHSFHGNDKIWKCTRCGKEMECRRAVDPPSAFAALFFN